jgi:carboxymethylenebutenolidase
MSVPGAVQDPERLQAADVDVQCHDGFMMPGYLAGPRDAGPHPGIIVIHDAWGLGDHTRDVARRFAGVGFDALAPDLYARTGAPEPDIDMAELLRVMTAIPDARAVRDLEAAAAHLRGLDGSNAKVGCIGFCAGGRGTLLFACSSDAPDAAVDCWGGYIDSAAPGAERLPTRPTPIIDLAEQLHCPLLLAGGAEDVNPSPEILAKLRDRLLAAGKDVTLDVFAGAGHAFFNDTRPAYRPEAAHRLWPMVLEFFASHLR